ncbi:hypothetical protein [Spongiimicrobium salis]|uniref:hypothetical protein n=1 Tax=Spongiimicrobium salis TaxID=1667022 RepID=UPI00374DB2E2
MKNKIQKILIWLPSVVLSMIYIQNGIGKIFRSDQMDKIISNDIVMSTVGIILLIATALFLYPKTLIWGTTILSCYMSCIVFIHLYKGKPFEVAALVVLGVIFATYLRRPEFFFQKK